MIQNINVRFLRGYLKPCLGIYARARGKSRSCVCLAPVASVPRTRALSGLRRRPGGVVSVGWTHPPASVTTGSVRDQQDKRGINRSHSAPKATRVPQLSA